MVIEVHKIPALDTSNYTLTRGMVQGGIAGHFDQVMNIMELAGFY